jgi:hypothetical protein
MILEERMKLLEIKNNLYQPLGIILKNGTQANIKKRDKFTVKEEDVCIEQIDALEKEDKIKVKIITK